MCGIDGVVYNSRWICLDTVVPFHGIVCVDGVLGEADICPLAPPV